MESTKSRAAAVWISSRFAILAAVSAVAYMAYLKPSLNMGAIGRYTRGNPNEVYSHLIGFMICSFLALLLGWLLLVEYLVKDTRHARVCVFSAFVITALLAISGLVLDIYFWGEGAIILSLPLCYAPLVGGTYFWTRKRVMAGASPLTSIFTFVIFVLAVQLLWEPSEYGGPQAQLLLAAWFVVLIHLVSTSRRWYARWHDVSPLPFEPYEIKTQFRRARIYLLVAVPLAVVTCAAWLHELLAFSGPVLEPEVARMTLEAIMLLVLVVAVLYEQRKFSTAAIQLGFVAAVAIFLVLISQMAFSLMSFVGAVFCGTAIVKYGKLDALARVMNEREVEWTRTEKKYTVLKLALHVMSLILVIETVFYVTFLPIF